MQNSAENMENSAEKGFKIWQEAGTGNLDNIASECYYLWCVSMTTFGAFLPK